ncbi:hypothetical protein NC653_021815 [Populus alba x Populus x berolinensis]|uniref:Uncharacterized protein n=1 Tax=Populus alba x Populus x berolinensis TaxID=444605 RepID=A0AAD6MQD9_9ROSI|nr:hypothetical protein NC653_021815 [Populus alba x Populus x berolinensis]
MVSYFILSYYLFISLDATLLIVIYLNAFTSDMKSFTVGEEEKGRKDGTKECSPMRVLEDCSVSTESKTSSCISNRYESETTSPRANITGSEGKPNATKAPCPWRDFFRVFRKGPAPSFHTLPPLKEGVPKLSKRRSRRRKFREAIVPTLNSPLDGEFCHFKSSWTNFSLSEHQAATDTFSKDLRFFFSSLSWGYDSETLLANSMVKHEFCFVCSCTSLDLNMLTIPCLPL